jgi:uncharacterized protein (DUF2267 family)
MQRDEFIQRVQENGNLDSQEEATQVTKAVLETLGERLYRTEQSQLSAQLPHGIREFVVEPRTIERSKGRVETYDLEEFYDRVGARADVGYQTAVRLTHIVMNVLQEAVSPGEIADIKQELSDGFGKLFEKST